MTVLIVTPPAIGELFVNVTAYELAYTRSPARMKGFVYSFTLFNQAISAAIALALAGVIRDPWLVWPWTAMAVITFCVAWVFPTYFKHLNVPMKDFANRDRQAGLHQPKYIEAEKTAAGKRPSISSQFVENNLVYLSSRTVSFCSCRSMQPLTIRLVVCRQSRLGPTSRILNLVDRQPA